MIEGGMLLFFVDAASSAVFDNTLLVRDDCAWWVTILDFCYKCLRLLSYLSKPLKICLVVTPGRIGHCHHDVRHGLPDDGAGAAIVGFGLELGMRSISIIYFLAST